ncbi:unnamed protein product [Phytophthora fragariaefolia]|uniref:Unnamed protein product n=1 Tax=Phytophthora fragariaefolia TaxID=1490495 RepID=A0A9W6WZ02_9STRA|nr:unnamed protein product [Phytophthora fragariaefolia]
MRAGSEASDPIGFERLMGRQEWRALTEGADALSAKSKKERFDEQSWDSLKSRPFYEVLCEYKDVLPDDISAELPQDKGVRHEVDLMSGTKLGKCRESKSPHSTPTVCVKKAQDGWRIVHAYNKLNDAMVPAQTPIPRKDVIIDSMALSNIFSALDLRDGFYPILMRESDVPLMAGTTLGGMLWEWLVMPQVLMNTPATFNRCVTHLLRSVRDFAPSYFDDVLIHSRAVNGTSDVEMYMEHLRKLFALMRKHKLYANLKKCFFGVSEIPVLGCLYNLQVEYKPGRLNVVADALSGRPDYAVNKADANAIGVVRTSTPSSSLLDDVRSAYANDADAKPLLNYFAAPSDKSRQKLAKHLRARLHRYRVHNGLLLYSAVDDNADRVVVPDDRELKRRITYEYHDAPTSGQPGSEKIYLLLTREFNWSHRDKPAPFSQAQL